MQIDFPHRHAGHCESGVTANLLSHQGLHLSEPMALGLSSALVFAHFPFMRWGGIPMTAYRMFPGAVIKGVAKQTGVKIAEERFKDRAAAKAALDAHLAAGRPVALRTNVYWLPYFPPDMRFHFNAHNIVAIGRDGDDYLVSDPVFEDIQRCDPEGLEKARFSLGPFAPKGLIYYPTEVPARWDPAKAIPKALKRTYNVMNRTPLPWVGLGTIHRLARTLRKLEGQPEKAEYSRQLVGSIIRMQEEIGTGGGGFRFMYAAFLQEAAELLQRENLAKAADEMTEAGDVWREFALLGARYVRQKRAPALSQLAECMERAAAQEGKVYPRLKHG
ncbi:BtrH N-terminal domain-containing protein [Alkalilimnicola sp. S0819]|uniref:BtrH N-terminal domain-containing protein n=1 Tax=Alkalilimnicola sp. S0819 TaxID=2613922 RepID=UPI0012625CEA|nr:BtrH N-terminal domain-containing protein [Alkalilimnicola sp. S0819]KAB7624165.1 DUF4872 domain-containing protein [Alkalilimnicola sp. S0819]MPQ16418.1 DUF4872 domain-containing protein [Alkalilimnicola sp. S0819]